jgi:hypothetical protein
MSDDKPTVNGSAPKSAVSPHMILQAAATSAIGAQANLLMAFGVDLPGTINLLCEVACNLIASIEPREQRDRVINEIRRNLPDVVARQYDARHMRASGLVVPGRPGGS